ncbi:MAG: helix-turn-helix transcriptional regulator [Fusicatenibacter sp.]
MIRKIEIYCRKKGMTHNALAKKAGISTSTLSYLLGGKSKPYVYTILQICNALGISLHDLVGDETKSSLLSDMEVDADGKLRIEEAEEPEESDEKRSELVLCERYRGLPEQKQKLLLTYLEMLEQYQKK